MLILSGHASRQHTAPFAYTCGRDYFSVEFGRESYDMTDMLAWGCNTSVAAGQKWFEAKL